MTEPDTRLAEIADLDHDRLARRGYPEAVYCAGKTAEQVGVIAAGVRDLAQVTLFTRADDEHAAAVRAALPDARCDAEAGLLAWPPDAAGTDRRSGGDRGRGHLRPAGRPGGDADGPVPRPANASWWWTSGWPACTGCSGRLDLLRKARVVVVVAGMDGALPSVVAGLVTAPVVAVPTSVGYGAAFEGLAALLAMLNACAPGVAVVNIDNGYGAGHLAAQISRPGPGVVSSADTPGSTPRPASPATCCSVRWSTPGADLGAVQRAVDAVIPGSVRVVARPVTRAGQRATKIDIEVLTDDLPHRPGRRSATLLAARRAGRAGARRAVAAFAALAEAEAAVHGIAARRGALPRGRRAGLDRRYRRGVRRPATSLDIDSLSASRGRGRIGPGPDGPRRAAGPRAGGGPARPRVADSVPAAPAS